MDEVDFTILAATSVFTDFMDKCPPAEACRDAFDRTVKATLKMVNASGGFGQQYRPGHVGGFSDLRVNLDQGRLDWGSRTDSTSTSSTSHHHKRQHRHQASSIDRLSAATSDTYSHNPSLLSAFQKGAQYRLPGSNATVKIEQDGFSHMRNLPPPPRTSASSADNNHNNPLTPETAHPSIDQQIMPSPSALQQQQQLSSPMAEIISTNTPPTTGYLSPQQQHTLHSQPQQQRQQQLQSQRQGERTPYNELQTLGIDFLQNNSTNAVTSSAAALNGTSGADTASSTGIDAVDFSGLADTQMDLGFGLGWEGLHHDFSDGQQLDLFDGFFFGGAGGGGGGVGGGSAGL